jgi:hypothetical protein
MAIVDHLLGVAGVFFVLREVGVGCDCHSSCLNWEDVRGVIVFWPLWRTREARDWMFWEGNWERWDEGKADEGR